MNTQTRVKLDDLTPYREIPTKYPHLYSEKSWAWAVANRNKNGLSGAFHKVGKKLFVNEVSLVDCIVKQEGK